MLLAALAKQPAWKVTTQSFGAPWTSNGGRRTRRLSLRRGEPGNGNRWQVDLSARPQQSWITATTHTLCREGHDDLETPRLILAEFSFDDLDRLAELVSDPPRSLYR